MVSAVNGEITSSRHQAAAAVATVMLSVVVVGVAGVFLLSGNGSGTAAPAPVTPTSAAPTSPTPSPSSAAVKPPVLPAEATKPTAKGAAAFFRYFWETFNYSYATLDSEALKSLSQASCRSCAGYAEAIDAAQSEGSQFVGGRVTVVAAVAAPGDVERGLVVNAVISQEPAFTIAKDGATAASVEATPEQRVDAAVAWRKNRWVMVGMDARGSS